MTGFHECGVTGYCLLKKEKRIPDKLGAGCRRFGACRAAPKPSEIVDFRGLPFSGRRSSSAGWVFRPASRGAARRSQASAGAGHVPRGAAAGNFCAGRIDKRRLWMYNPNDI